MKFIYTKHSITRVSQRKLSKEQIETAILNPDKILPAYKKRILVQKTFGNDILEVIYKKEQELIIIVTAYWLEEV